LERVLNGEDGTILLTSQTKLSDLSPYSSEIAGGENYQNANALIEIKNFACLRHFAAEFPIEKLDKLPEVEADYGSDSRERKGSLIESPVLEESGP